MADRTCKKCGEVKDDYLFQFQVRNDKAIFSTECKACLVLRVQNWRKNNPSKYKAQIIQKRLKRKKD